MPSTVAIRKCAELVFVPPRFDVYREVSKQIHAIFKNYTPLVEPLSLDEAYLDVTDNLKGIPTAWETAKEIRARIYDETKLTASAGISCNKFLAKLASDYRKPNGQFAIMPDQAEAFIATLPVAKFHGVGPKTTAKMHALGIETGSDLRRQTLDFLQDRFGKSGSWYYDIARGRDERPVEPDQERKSLGSETTFPEDRIDPVQIEAGVIAMANDVWAWCEKTNSHGRTVTVKIKWADFQISTRSRSMEMTIETREKLHQVALDLIRSVFPPQKGVQLVGVSLSNLTPIRSYRKLEAIWRRFDREANFPGGFLLVGDSVASFNPIYGQGMSTAWLQAVALENLLSQRAVDGRGLDGLATDFFPEAARISKEAWNGSTLVDSAYPEVTGDMRPGTKQAVIYLRVLRTLLADDPELHADYIGVSQMTTPGAVLMRPDRMQRVMAAMTRLS